MNFYANGPGLAMTTAKIAQVFFRPGVTGPACNASQNSCVDSNGWFADIAVVRLEADGNTNENAMSGMQAMLAWRYPGAGHLVTKVGAGRHDNDDVPNPTGVLKQLDDTLDSANDDDGEVETIVGDTNDGDSGGPLYFSTPVLGTPSAQVLGTMWGGGWDPLDGYYTLYTSVSRHLEWILTSINYRWRGQPRQASTTFTASSISSFTAATEMRCMYACEGTTSCEGYAYNSVAGQCRLHAGITGATTTANWFGALKHARTGTSGFTVGFLRSDGGAGGMGVVWGARDPELERHIAIKLVQASRAQQRMLQEARALAKLSHPNVVPVHDVGTLDDQVYLVMEWVPGQTLRAWCEGRTPREILRIYRPAGEGLATVHAVGLVHRDFKPDNAIKIAVLLSACAATSSTGPCDGASGSPP